VIDAAWLFTAQSWLLDLRYRRAIRGGKETATHED
jgi:hypothetical protein